MCHSFSKTKFKIDGKFNTFQLDALYSSLKLDLLTALDNSWYMEKARFKFWCYTKYVHTN